MADQELVGAAPDMRQSVFRKAQPVGKGLDRGDKQLDALISRAHHKREAAGENNATLVEAEWDRAAERLKATRRATNAALKAEHHRRLADVFAGFSTRHAAEAARYEETNDRKEPTA